MRRENLSCHEGTHGRFISSIWSTVRGFSRRVGKGSTRKCLAMRVSMMGSPPHRACDCRGSAPLPPTSTWTSRHRTRMLTMCSQHNA